MEQYLQVGVISQTHGLKGEVKVFPTTDDSNRFKKCKGLLLDVKGQYKELHVEQVKFFKQFVILKFEEFNDINEVEQYKSCGLFVTRENAVKLKKDEYFIADLIGLSVFDEENQLLGELIDVIETGANDVYDIKMTNGESLLLPAIKDCILDVNIDERTMKVHVLEGLL